MIARKRRRVGRVRMPAFLAHFARSVRVMVVRMVMRMGVMMGMRMRRAMPEIVRMVVPGVRICMRRLRMAVRVGMRMPGMRVGMGGGGREAARRAED